MSSKLSEIKRLAGSVFFFSLSGEFLSGSEASFFRETSPRGILFFKRNIESLNSIKMLIKDLRKIDSIDFFAVDEEGGRVKRLPKGNYSLPSAEEMSRLDENEFAEKVFLLAETFRDIGLNMNMAPVVDIRSGELDSIIGDRSFADNPETVVRKAKIFIDSMKKGGVFPVIKHFPGHGTTIIDSHKALPKINKNFKELEKEDIFPFRKLAFDSGIVMIAHLLFEGFSDEPSSLSLEWGTYLRNTIGFKGLTIIDDIEMKALDVYSSKEKISLFINAGYDMMPVCSGNIELMHELWEHTLYAIEKNDNLRKRLENSMKKMIYQGEKL